MTGIVLGTAIGALIALCLVVLLIVWSWSPGEVEPYYDAHGEVLDGSVSEIVRMTIGGVEQGMIIKGKNVNNPVILFLHGGPGNPQYAMTRDVGLEDCFTFCWWDQRGGGMSYSSRAECEKITLDQLVSDTVEVTNYLRERFGQVKIYLLGNSFGSFLGINVVDRHPELYEAYIGTAQVTNQLEAEKLGYAKMMSVAQADGDNAAVIKLEKYQLDGAGAITPDYLKLRSDIMAKQGIGHFHNPKGSILQWAILPLLKAREYTLSDKLKYIEGATYMLNAPANSAQMETDIFETIPKLDIPAYFIMGAFDYQVSFELAEKYFNSLSAPEKRFYTLENCAHNIHMEEPDEFWRIVKEIAFRQ